MPNESGNNLMQLTVYHLKNCDTCKKAIKALEGARHTLNLVDVRADGIDAKLLTKFANAVGFEMLLNTRSSTWRGLEDAHKQDIDEAKAIALMVEHPTLMKRPVIDAQSTITVGWTKPVQDALL